MKSKTPEKVKPLNLVNLRYYIVFTLRTSFYRYYKKNRGLSFSRILSMFYPNLKSPVFVVGAPRSGTTFLGKCIEKLPEVSYHFEPVLTKAASRDVYLKNRPEKQLQFIYRTVYRILMMLHFDADLRFVEKTPRNACIVEFLSKTFPDSVFIHIIRDGRDAALSYSKKPWHNSNSLKEVKYEPGGYLYGTTAHHWVEPERTKEFETTSDIHRSIWAWKAHTSHAIESLAKLPQERVLELHYESIVSDPVPEADRILDFLQIENPYSRKIFHTSVNEVQTTSVGGWETSFDGSQLNVIYKEAGSLLQRLNYISSPVSKSRIV